MNYDTLNTPSKPMRLHSCETILARQIGNGLVTNDIATSEDKKPASGTGNMVDSGRPTSRIRFRMFPQEYTNYDRIHHTHMRTPIRTSARARMPDAYTHTHIPRTHLPLVFLRDPPSPGLRPRLTTALSRSASTSTFSPDFRTRL
jgi:hypothetical protein